MAKGCRPLGWTWLRHWQGMLLLLLIDPAQNTNNQTSFIPWECPNSSCLCFWWQHLQLLLKKLITFDFWVVKKLWDLTSKVPISRAFIVWHWISCLPSFKCIRSYGHCFHTPLWLTSKQIWHSNNLIFTLLSMKGRTKLSKRKKKKASQTTIDEKKIIF